MRVRICRGVTLVEMLMVISVFALVFIAVTALMLQSSRLYAKVSPHIEPHQSQMLALKRMEREIREAMTIAPMPDVPESNYVDIVMPQKDANGRYIVTKETVVKEVLDDNDQPVLDPISGLPKTITYDHLALQKENKRVRFYLGENPETGDIDTVFRAEVSEDGSAFLSTPKVVISGVTADPMIFAFSPYEQSTTTGTTSATLTGATLITIRLTAPVRVNTGHGVETINDTLSTQFRMRNLHTAT